ncbi:hypothetical protein [Sporosarcina sp. G11-34]|nr:hypothetical protein [Sporosarcina sp. G11-34]MCZ2258204.1 hypothetical protein [Sporosarcina sp. G11-34]
MNTFQELINAVIINQENRLISYVYTILWKRKDTIYYAWLLSVGFMYLFM